MISRDPLQILDNFLKDLLSLNSKPSYLVTILETLVTTTLESLNSFSIVFMKKLLVKSAKDELASSDSALSQVYCNFVITEAEGSFINHVDKSIQIKISSECLCFWQ